MHMSIADTEEGIKRLEAESLESQKSVGNFLISILENIPDMVFIKDAQDLHFVFINRAGEALLGTPRTALIGKNDYDLFPKTQADLFTRKDREVLQSSTTLDILEEEIDTKSQGKRILHTKKVPILDNKGNPVFLLGISEDITRRKQAETEVMHEKIRAEQYLHISRAMIVGLDREGNVNLINPRGCDILGYTEEEIMGRSWFETVLPEAVLNTVQEVFRQVISGEKEPLTYAENEILTRNGDIRYIAWNNTVQKNTYGEIVGTLSSGQDITERRQAEEEARRHQQELAHVMRLSAVGEMASGLAHELNQPLTAITSYCESALAMFENPSLSSPAVGIAEMLRRAIAQARRAADVIRHLRNYLRKGDAQKKPVDVDQLVRSATRFFGWELQTPDLRIELRLQSQGSKVFANEVQLEQVLLNLLRNGREAINSINATGGRLILKTCVTPNDFIEISLSDNGPGIGEAMLGKIFEPFQTTKDTGMGIGLSISRSIVEMHGGHMWASNIPHGGAVFGFTLPIVHD
jgi:two-component system sensor kinase FixL